MVDPHVIRSLEEAVPGLVASLGAWGVVSMHWLPDLNDQPVVWLTTRTESQRASLEAAPWLSPQVTVLLMRAQAPYEILKGLRVLVDSEEAQGRLLGETP